MRDPRPRSSRGFTLIELLVVVAVIGILAAIAMPQYAQYRSRSFNARVQTDARNAATAQEAYYVDNLTYLSGACDTLPGFSLSDGVTCNTSLVGADQFQVDVSHPGMSFDSGCTWLSQPGGGGGNLSCS